MTSEYIEREQPPLEQIKTIIEQNSIVTLDPVISDQSNSILLCCETLDDSVDLVRGVGVSIIDETGYAITGIREHESSIEVWFDEVEFTDADDSTELGEQVGQVTLDPTTDHGAFRFEQLSSCYTLVAETASSYGEMTFELYDNE